jgi:arginase
VDVCGGASARVEDVVPIGYRDPDEIPTFEQIAPELGPAFRPVSKDEVTSEGPGAVGAPIAEDLGARAGRFWMHLDVDILGEDEFPATDYLMPDGLDMGQLVELMRPLAASPVLIGVSIGCYNPEKDPGDVYGLALVEAFRATLTP